jgi:hypothetical protein
MGINWWMGLIWLSDGMGGKDHIKEKQGVSRMSVKKSTGLSTPSAPVEKGAKDDWKPIGDVVAQIMKGWGK